MALTKVSYSMIAGAAINVLDYGAVGDAPSGGGYIYFTITYLVD